MLQDHDNQIVITRHYEQVFCPARLQNTTAADPNNTVQGGLGGGTKNMTKMYCVKNFKVRKLTKNVKKNNFLQGPSCGSTCL